MTAKKKARKVKALLFDVDGVLTDGKIIYTNSGDEIKSFNVKDGQSIKMVKKLGFKTGGITSRKSEIVKRRLEELKIDFIQQATAKKLDAYNNFKDKFDLSNDEIAYIGDDVNDAPVLKACGFGVCPDDSPKYLKKLADFKTKCKGGEGVVREVVEFILRSKK